MTAALFTREPPPIPTGTEDLTGTVVAIIWASWNRPDATPDEPGMIIARLQENADGTQGPCVKGPCQENGIERGMAYRFLGRWTEHHQHGRQFTFTTFVSASPATRRGTVSYLTKLCPNVGQVKAEQLWSFFGPLTTETIRERPDEIARSRVLTIDQANEASIALKQHAHLEATKLDLFGLFDRRGFPGRIIDACIGKWGARAHAIVRRNPFKLMTARPKLPGAGFRRCDKLYLDLGGRPDAIKRQMLCAWNVLREDSQGHTWISFPCVREAVVKAIREGKANAQKAITLGDRAGWLATYTDPANGSSWVAERIQARNERTIAERISVLRQAKPLWDAAEIVSESLSPHQHAALTTTLGSAVGILSGCPGTGKAQPLDAKILTPAGWKLMGEIQPGDEVYSQDGTPTKVLSIHPQGEIDIYRVTFSDGSSTECSNDHLWLTQTRHARKAAQRNKRPLFQAAHVRTTKEIADTILSEDAHRNHFVPMVEPLQFEERELPLDPYLLGLLLGDGCFRGGSVGFSKPDRELVESIRRLLPGDCRINTDKESDKDHHIVGVSPGRTNSVLTALRNLGLWGKFSKEKHIPNNYKFAPVSVRIAVLQGLLDTDASVCDGYDLEFSSSSCQLAEDVQFIIQSIGGKARITSRVPVYSHLGEKREGEVSYRLHISLPSGIVPFRLSRKRDKYRPRSKYQPCRVVTSVEFVGQKQAQCIAVEHPSRLYVTDHCIVTHNTYTAAQVVKYLACKIGLSQVAVCAPTGKAAVRITAAMKTYALDIAATTIHRLLGITRNGHDGDGWGFECNALNPLPFKVVVVDEVSMLDTDLFAALLAACAPGTHLLLIGDPHQLPPVGHGAPLRDMIAAGIPNGHLTEIRRNAGMIVHACAKIKDGQDFETASTFDPDNGLNLRMIETANAKESVEFLQAILARMSETKLFPNIVEDVQVLVALNAKSLVSRAALNKALQTQLNPHGKTADKNPFRVGDKIICVKNNAYPAVEYHLGSGGGDNVDAYRQLTAETFIANGDQGRVLAVAPKVLVARFVAPGRTVKIHLGKVKEEDERDGDLDGQASSNGDSGSSDNDTASRTGTGCDFALAYAITTHKSQGSEWSCVIVMIDDSPGAKRLCSREHIYTSISRGKQLVVLIGQKQVLLQQCRKVSLDKRKTFLRELLTAGLAPTQEACK